MECTRWHTNQQAYLEVIWKENKTDDVICLHFGVYGNICGHMIPSSVMDNYGYVRMRYGCCRSVAYSGVRYGFSNRCFWTMYSHTRSHGYLWIDRSYLSVISITNRMLSAVGRICAYRVKGPYVFYVSICV